MFQFASGVITMGFLVASLFFVRFWRQTSDGLFLAFGVAFCLLALNQAILGLTNLPVEERSWIYLLRLAAFLVIIVAVLQKNSRSRIAKR
ncbi:DUF5985 family protein [Chthonobacter rhizosphaerae]|uniref:DUF5985 family protein n=1 Tax=Chthonobacter rhizosphaerae TaxID=2735553 RepID=UPI0015EFD253|nr:DUF5985 family protein [Chthonobacter rhizosphaerae]